MLAYYKADRITPAHAGTTDTNIGLCLYVQDHPRSRGDYAFFFLVQFISLGSPPLTRGLHSVWSVRIVRLRITPAHAGTTTQDFQRIQLKEDHPRSRGDYSKFQLP